MIDAVLAKIFGTQNERDIKAIRPLIVAINALEEVMRADKQIVLVAQKAADDVLADARREADALRITAEREASEARTEAAREASRTLDDAHNRAATQGPGTKHVLGFTALHSLCT